MASYAIIETGGKQLRVEPGRFYDVERLTGEPDSAVTIDKVFFVHHEDDISVGQPFVEGATIEGTILKHLRGEKVIVYKMRPKKKTRKKQGHRQELTRLLVNTINVNGTTIGEPAATQTATAAAAPAEVAEEVDAEAIVVAAAPVDVVEEPDAEATEVDAPVDVVEELDVAEATEVDASVDEAEEPDDTEAEEPDAEEEA
jgi:large subunit ribosomal protein L21